MAELPLRFLIDAEYAQFCVQDVEPYDSWMAKHAMDPDLPPGGWSGDAVQIHRIGLEPYSISVGTARDGMVETLITSRSSAPRPEPAAEHIVEADLDAPTGKLSIFSIGDAGHATAVPAGLLRVRISYIPSEPPATGSRSCVRRFAATTLEPGADQPVLRQGRAIGWIEGALSPLCETHPALDVNWLAVAIRVVTGIEALIWLTDIAGQSREQAAETQCWSALARLAAALAETSPTPMPATRASRPVAADDSQSPITMVGPVETVPHVGRAQTAKWALPPPSNQCSGST